MGLVLTQAPGEYRGDFHGGAPAAEYTADDLQGAIQHGREMAPRATAPALPPFVNLALVPIEEL